MRVNGLPVWLLKILQSVSAVMACCSTATPTDCVVILKPFPKAFFRY